MLLRFFVLTVLLALPGVLYASVQTVVYTRAFAGEAYGYYHVAVLQAALNATNADYGEAIAEAHPQPMPQARQIVTLLKDGADIMWSATSDERESQLLPVRFPLLQGWQVIVCSL